MHTPGQLPCCQVLLELTLPGMRLCPHYSPAQDLAVAPHTAPGPRIKITLCTLAFLLHPNLEQTYVSGFVSQSSPTPSP